MTFDPQDPFDVVFTEIDDLAEIADAIGDPLTNVQQTKVGYVRSPTEHKTLFGGTKEVG